MAPVRRRNKQRQSGVKQEVASTDDGDKKGGRRRKAAAAAAASGSGSSAVKKEDDGPLPPFRRPSRTAAAASASASAPKGTILVNRAPVLTLWVAVVANVQGYSWDSSLTFGRFVAGMFAQAKGRSLGIYGGNSRSGGGSGRTKGKDDELPLTVAVFGQHIPVVYVQEEHEKQPRALVRGKPVVPETAARYLATAFHDALPEARKALVALATAIGSTEQLNKQAYDLYCQFRPQVQGGVKGWGQKAEFDLGFVRALAQSLAK
eukprot:m.74179 g.74179  ORF g.74179 m.74179 type:complete len:262 (-) comp14412_c0_seq2:65-850(-)